MKERIEKAGASYNNGTSTNCGGTKHYSEETVQRLFENQVERRHAGLAVFDRNRRVSYGELNQQANQIAHYLLHYKVRREEPVGVLLGNSLDSVAVVLGVLKAGCAYVPLDPSYPMERIVQIIKEASLSMVVHNRNSQFRCDGVRSINLDEHYTKILKMSEDNPQVESGANNLAYIMFTSGSTGSPKGIAGIHASITNSLAAVPNDKEVQDEIWCLSVSLSVGASVSRLFLPLLCGIPLCVPSDEERRDAFRLVAAIYEYNVTNVFLVTPLLREILHVGNPLTRSLRRVRTVVSGGAGGAPDIIEKFQTEMPHARLIDGYGATEVGGPIYLWTWEAGSNSPKGRLFPNVDIHIMDEKACLVVNGAVGEVYVGALHLAREYWNNPELTAAYFVKDSLSDESGARLFRTGDVGRLRDDGVLELLGRKDGVVKIRGFRIDVTEIESVLHKCPGVHEAAITAQEYKGDERLVAFIVVDNQSRLHVADVRLFLSLRLPTYMLPSAFVIVEGQLPRLVSGKLDRVALKSENCYHSQVMDENDPTDTGIEAAILKVWSDVLNVPNIGVDDNFLELGGHSLLAVRVALQLSESLGIDLPLDLFMGPLSILEIADLIRSSGPTRNGSE